MIVCAMTRDEGEGYRVMRMDPHGAAAVATLPTLDAALAELARIQGEPGNEWAFFFVRDPRGNDSHTSRPRALTERQP